MCFVHWNTFILKPTGFQELLSFINKGFFFILFSARFSKNRQNTCLYSLNSAELLKIPLLSLRQKNSFISHIFDEIKIFRVPL